jgi:ABC-2 type transport system ATP-binding protein
VSEAVVEVEGLVIRYGAVTAVDGVSMTASAGTVTVVAGPNGAGKTSTIEAAEGYRRPAGGTVRVLGLEPATEQRRLSERMGVMLQGGGIPPGMRVGEAVQLHCAYHGARGAQPRDLIELVGLGQRTRSTWRQLSGGEQQRLSLALALAGHPDVVFLDEPTSGVDVHGRQVVRLIVRELAASGCCVVLTTHELAEAERMADAVVVIDHGRVVASGSLVELCGGDDRVSFDAPAGLTLGALGAVENRPGRYEISGAATAERLAQLTAALADQGVALSSLDTGRRSLEDVVLSLTGPEARR